MVGQASHRAGMGFRRDDRHAGAVDALDAVSRDREGFGFEDRRERGECEIVIVAQIERRDRWVEEIVEQRFGQVMDCSIVDWFGVCVVVHARIVACGLRHSRGK